MRQLTPCMGQMDVVLLQVSETVKAIVDNGDGFSSCCARARLKVLCDDVEDSRLRGLGMPSDGATMC